MSRQPLAVDFFLIAHDPFDDGRLTVGSEMLGCGLVGAELADLVLARRLEIEGDLVVLPRTGRQLDEIDEYVIQAVADQDSVHPVRFWVEPLQDGLYALIAQNLVASGIVRRQHSTRRIGRGRQPDRFPANDLLAACRPRQQLAELLRTPKNFTLRDGVLAALVGVRGIEGVLDVDVDRASMRELLGEIEANLPPDLQTVCDALRSVTTEVSLRSR